MKVFARILFALTLLGLVSCGGTKSAQQVMAEDRAYMYKEAYKAYIDAENKYLNLLFNISYFIKTFFYPCAYFICSVI